MHNDSNNKDEVTIKERTILPDYLLKLAEGFSTQTKTASKFWLVLAIISLIVIMPSQVTTSIKIPFELGTIKQSDFYPFSAFLISVLIIGFGSAHVQSIRSRVLIQRIIDNQKDKYLPGKVHLRDFIDSIVSPSISRTAPLAQYLRGKHQFFPESTHSPKFINYLSSSAYILLKIATLLVIYIAPTFALFKALINGNLFLLFNHSCGIPNIVFLFISLIALLILLELLSSELLYTITSIRHIIKKENDSEL
jgi:hypothetical protein